MIVIEPDRPVEGLRRVSGGHEIRPNHMKVKRRFESCRPSHAVGLAMLVRVAGNSIATGVGDRAQWSRVFRSGLAELGCFLPLSHGLACCCPEVVR
jgi:hypothetical protein